MDWPYIVCVSSLNLCVYVCVGLRLIEFITIFIVFRLCSFYSMSIGYFFHNLFCESSFVCTLCLFL